MADAAAAALLAEDASPMGGGVGGCKPKKAKQGGQSKSQSKKAKAKAKKADAGAKAKASVEAAERERQVNEEARVAALVKGMMQQRAEEAREAKAWEESAAMEKAQAKINVLLAEQAELAETRRDQEQETLRKAQVPGMPPQSMTATASSGPWACVKCTFENLQALQQCEMCGDARPLHPTPMPTPPLPKQATALPLQQPEPAKAHSPASPAGAAGAGAMLECPICMDEYVSPPSERMPVSLPCGHSLCKLCITKMQTAALREHKGSGPLAVQCPKCREMLNLPPGGVGALPCNYSVVEMLEALACERGEHEACLQAAPAVTAAAPPGTPSAAAPRTLPMRIVVLEALWGVEAKGSTSDYLARVSALEVLLRGAMGHGALLTRVTELEHLSSL
jgi:hypothetical protein